MRVEYTSEDRNLGCTVELVDNGRRQSVPVCMGGLAYIGCNEWLDECQRQYEDRAPNNRVESVSIVEDVVAAAVSVRRTSTSG